MKIAENCLLMLRQPKEWITEVWENVPPANLHTQKNKKYYC